MLLRRTRLFAAAAAVAACVSPAGARAADVVVFAAASLKTGLDAAAEAWAAKTGGETAISYAASSALARQIEVGAPADVFISADLDWMDYLAERGLIDTDSRRNLFGNRLVLIGGAGAAPVEITPDLDLARALDGGRLAVGEVTSVPAGRYAKVALESLGLWSSVEGSLAQAENVRVALAYVALGEAPLGIVYATDATAEEKVTVVGTFPQDSHPPIIYPAALTADTANTDAAAFLDFLSSDAARDLFEAQGFMRLDATHADAYAG